MAQMENNGFSTEQVIEMVRWDVEDALYYLMRAEYKHSTRKIECRVTYNALNDTLMHVLSYCKTKEEAAAVMQTVQEHAREQFERWRVYYEKTQKETEADGE